MRVCLHGLSPSNGVSGTEGYVLLENPVGENTLTLEKLEQEVSTSFWLEGNTVLLGFVILFVV